MNLPNNKISGIRPRQKYEGHTELVWDVIHLPDGQRMVTCSRDGSLRVWDLKSGKQIGDDWRDGESEVYSIALSPDGKKVVSGSEDGAVKLWDINTCKVIMKWMGHTDEVRSVCWSRDGQRVLSGSYDGTARQWDVESGEIEPVETGHRNVGAVIYSPDMTTFATAGYDESSTAGHRECSVKIWDAQSSELVATLKGHTSWVNCLAWTKDGTVLISGSSDHSIRTWDVKTWKQTAVLNGHTNRVFAIAISPNGRNLASASFDNTTRLWNLDNGQPINLPLQHASSVYCVSFSVDGNQLATGCYDNNTYTWGLDDTRSSKSATQRSVQRRSAARRTPAGFFDDFHFSVPRRPRLSAPQGSTLTGRLSRRSPSDARTTSPSSLLDWARYLLKLRRQSGEEVVLREHPVAVQASYTIEIPRGYNIQ